MAAGVLFFEERALIVIKVCGYELFSCLNNFGPVSSLTSRLRGSDNGEWFVIPAKVEVSTLSGHSFQYPLGVGVYSLSLRVLS